ncbi:MAG: prepilin-type N-terminal cleavage/methylation domain-containing protein [Thermodesulfobacteriota bacterium]
MNRGFTLIELLIGVLIAGIIAAIAVPMIQQQLAESAESVAIADIGIIVSKFDAILKESPDSLPEDQAAFDAYCQTAGLKCTDPWHNPYQYLRLFNRPGNENQARKDHNLHPINTYFDLYSKGPDGNSVKALTGGPSQDDIICANDGAYIGTVSSYPGL